LVAISGCYVEYMLFERDYNILTPEELNRFNKAKEFYSKKKDNFGGMKGHHLMKYYEMLPRSAYYYESLFPNNYLDIGLLKNANSLENIRQQFTDLLDSDISERDILNFINRNEHYYIIGSLYHAGYDFGHHIAFLFKEFELTSTYKADYLLVGKNSGGFNFIFVELENPYSNITLNDGELGETFRKGVKQVKNWDDWIEGNFNTLRLIFQKYKNPRKELPKEFYELDKSRLNYIVLAGRRANFKDKTYRIKRKTLKSSNIKLMHYDNLIDSFATLIETKNY
jgi:translation initiation factor 2 beta subunit (eIF-2beta)/eIF-5